MKGVIRLYNEDNEEKRVYYYTRSRDGRRVIAQCRRRHFHKKGWYIQVAPNADERKVNFYGENTLYLIKEPVQKLLIRTIDWDKVKKSAEPLEFLNHR